MSSQQPNLLIRIFFTISISVTMVVYTHLRWEKISLLSWVLIIVGCLIFYFSFGVLFAFVKKYLKSDYKEKVYAIKSIVYLIVIWGIILASAQSYWRFEGQHEISICPGWSNNVEETSFPILVKVINRGTNLEIPISKFKEISGEQHWISDKKALEIRECVYYHYTDSEKIEMIAFHFTSGKEFLPAQVTANDAGATLDMEARDEVRVGVVLTPTSVYNLTWMTILLYMVRWILLLFVAGVFAIYTLYVMQSLYSVMVRFLKRKPSLAYTGLMVIQSGVIAVWLVRKINFEWYLSAIVWFFITILTVIGFGQFSNWILPAAEDSKTQSKVILFAFCTSILLSLFIPLQPSGLFGIVSPVTSLNVLFNTRLLEKIVLVDLFLLAIFSFLTNTRKVHHPSPTLARWWMLVYAFPMMAVGVVMLLAFYPGIMSLDSLDQWIQLSNFSFKPWHPIFHTLLNWLVTRVWMSPAAIASAQILGVSLTVGYVLYRYEKVGLPKLLVIATAVVAAVVPVNAFHMATLWKDIPYAITSVWLTFLLYEIYISSGRWIIKTRNMVLMSALISFAALIRYNGPVEMVIMGILLVVIYKTHWKEWILIGVMAVTIITSTNFAIERSIPKSNPLNKMATQGGLIRIVEHHIRAHIYMGTEILKAERDLLSQVIPTLAVIDHYNCHTSLGSRFYYSDMLFDPNNTYEIFQAFVALALRAPWVEIRHLICNQSNIWRVFPKDDETMDLVPVRVSASSGEIRYHVPPEYAELAGVSQDSKLPTLAGIFGKYISKASKDKSLFAVPWRVAPYLYVLILGLIFRGLIYEGKWQLLIIGGHVFAHLILFTFVNLFEDFRYHYMIGLNACILWPLLFLRGSVPKSTGN